MRVCGGQTHTLVKAGHRRGAAGRRAVIHGPGLPGLRPRPLEQIRQGAASPGPCGPVHLHQLTGDSRASRVRRPTCCRSRPAGADVRIGVLAAGRRADRGGQSRPRVVFFAIGFETTGSGNAMAVAQAARLGLGNFTVLVSPRPCAPGHDCDPRVADVPGPGFLAAGHVCAVMGLTEYEPIAERYHVR